ncbi:MAG TPA: AMP-binding protein [Bacteroidota bacterium]|nr:AMP-binding protein [Bacteroidota bacterium]
MKQPLKLYPMPHIESLQDMLLKSSAQYSEKLALEDLKDTPIPRATYASLLKYVLKFGTALKNLKLPERSHIAVIGENRVQWGITYLTAMCFNYVIVPIDRNLTTNEILNILHEAEADAVVFSDSFDTMLQEERHSLKRLKYFISMDLLTKKDGFLSMIELINNSRGCSMSELPQIDPKILAVIIFTSGTLGRAKGVMLSQYNIATDLTAMASMIHIFPSDRFLSVLPMHHTYECTCGFLCPLYCGASAHYARSLKYISDDMQQVQATLVLGVPLLFDKMFKRIYQGIKEKKLISLLFPTLVKISNVAAKFGWKSSKKLVFSEIHEKFGGHIRIFVAGGAAPDPEVAKGLRELGFNFVQGYGLTETSPILALNQLDRFKDDAAGLPMPCVELRIHEPNEEGIGEIFAKGSNVTLGIYKNEKATREAFENDWFKTGDLGYFDDDGFLHICGRQKNVIISRSGKNVYPEEIEDVLMRSPFIQECLVYGEDDPKLDEVIAAQIVVDAEAFIELSESRQVSITPELINEVIGVEIKKANAELTGFKQIRKFTIREQEFEKTTTQKIKRFLVTPK